MSVVGHLKLIPPAAWPLGVGLLLNSTILFGNLGIGIAGAVPIVREKLGKSALRPKDKVRVWSLFYKTAAAYIVPAIIGTTSLHLLAAYLTTSQRVRNFSLVAAAASFTIPFHTLIFIMPTNKVLLGMDAKASLTPAEEKDVPFYIDKWNTLHGARFVQYTISWAAGLGALFGIVGRW